MLSDVNFVQHYFLSRGHSVPRTYEFFFGRTQMPQGLSLELETPAQNFNHDQVTQVLEKFSCDTLGSRNN